jgi:DNA primase
LHWDELDSSLSPTMHTIRTLPARLAQHGDLFQKALTDRQDLAPAIEALAEQVARE